MLSRSGVAKLLRAQPNWLLLPEAVALVLAIGFVDYITGYEISLFVFYAIPIMMVVWFGDRKSSIFIAIFSALVWWWADWKAGHPYVTDWGEAWGTCVQLIFFLFVVGGGSAMKNQKDAIQARFSAFERARELESEIIRISESEQQRIGQDLHDGLCPQLAAICCAATSLKDDLQARAVPEAAVAGEIEELIKGAVVHARNLARGIFPVQMDESGLPAALEELAATTGHLTHVAVSFECRDGMTFADRTRAMHLYRIAQEAISNAIKHGKARKVVVALTGDDEVFELTITDDGTGFQKSRGPAKGMGMKTMAYRARLIGARLETGNNPGGGAYLSCAVVPQTSAKEI